MAALAAAHLVVPAHAIDDYLKARGYTPQQLERGQVKAPDGSAITPAHIQAAILATDPVYFGEAMFINRPDAGGGPWRYFDYQKASLRYRGNVVHEDAAGVGKTREIVTLVLFGAVMQVGGQLVASAEDGNLDVMWDEIEWLLSQNEWLRRQFDPGLIRVKPYKKLGAKNGNMVYLRPAGHDGRAFRSIHVGLRGNFDEAAIPKNPVVFSEFSRALNPQAEQREYSVPDGVRSSPFYKRCENAIPYEDGMATPPGGKFVRFRWPRTLMPEPHWGPVAEREAIERFGGRDTPGYARNVHGLWGDPEDTIFPWSVFSPCLRFVPEYVVLKVLFDGSTNTFYVEAHRLSPGYQVRAGSDVEREDEGSVGPLTEIYKSSFALGNFDIADVVKRILIPMPATAHLVGGIDVGGSTKEPTEICLSELRGEQRVWVARVQLKNIVYDLQDSAIRALEEVYAPDHGWGLDAGGVGRVVEHNLRSGSGGFRFEDRLTGFVPNAKCDDFNDTTGEEIEPEPGKRTRRISYKELATQVLEVGFQRGRHVVPWDPDYIRDFPSHTATKGASGERIYSQKNDHTVDSKRMETLRLLEIERGGLGSGPTEFAVTQNSRRMNLATQGF